MSIGKAKAEEDDLDELDDVLEQFTNPPPALPPTSTPLPHCSATPTAPVTSNQLDADDALSEEFAKHFAAEMETLMRQLSGNASSVPPNSGGASGSDSKAQDATFRETWDRMLAQDLEATGRSDDLETFVGKSEDLRKDIKVISEEPRQDARGELTSEEDDPFQRVIRQAMEKLQESDETLKADSRGAQDSLEGVLASLGDLNLGEDAEGGENLESVLETMMSQLMSKEILYDPLKELDIKYPEYLSKNASTLSSEDLSRYTDQRIRVSQIVALFENPSYSDDNAAQSAEVLRLMSEMQSFGSPPSEIMGPLPPGLELGVDGAPNMPDGCVTT